MYTLSLPSGTFRKDGVTFPQDDNNTEWVAYALWLAAGNGPVQIADQEMPESRPHITVSAWQIRKALNQTGLRQSVEDAVAASGNIELQDGWLHSPTFDSDNLLTVSMAQGLGKSPDEMYALFQLAKTL